MMVPTQIADGLVCDIFGVGPCLIFLKWKLVVRKKAKIRQLRTEAPEL